MSPQVLPCIGKQKIETRRSGRSRAKMRCNVSKAGGRVAGVAMLVDRSAGATRFEVPAVSLLELSFPTYPADAVPAELAKLPIQKPGS